MDNEIERTEGPFFLAVPIMAMQGVRGIEMNKIEVNLARDAGIAEEVFSHELGHFNVSELCKGLKDGSIPFQKCCCKFSDLQMVDGMECDAFEYLVANREIDEERVKALTLKELAEPLIVLETNNGSELIVDGIHRLVRLKRDKYVEFRFLLVPIDCAPTVDMSKVHELKWGAKDFVNGKLVDRGQS